jgi:lipid-A-disaccharide synthase
MNVRFITLINVLLDREAVPEFLQSRCKPGALADAVVRLLTDKNAAERQIADLDAATKLLGKGGEAPSLRAARAIIEFVRGGGTG